MHAETEYKELPLGPHAVEEALAALGKLARSARRLAGRLAAASAAQQSEWIQRLEPKAAV